MLNDSWQLCFIRRRIAKNCFKKRKRYENLNQLCFTVCLSRIKMKQKLLKIKTRKQNTNDNVQHKLPQIKKTFGFLFGEQEKHQTFMMVSNIIISSRVMQLIRLITIKRSAPVSRSLFICFMLQTVDRERLNGH